MSSPESAASLRVLVVEFLPSGGMFQFGFQFADALASAGHTVELMTGPQPELSSTQSALRVLDSLPTWHPNAEVSGGPLRRKLRRAWRAVLLLESWRRVLVRARRTRPDVLQFGELRYSLDTAAFLVIARLGRQRVLVDLAHNPVPYDVHAKDATVEKGGRLTRGLLSRAYGAADLVLVLAEKPREELLSHFPSVRRVAICGHGDYSGVMDATQAGTPSAAGQTILFFGAWTKYKNIPLLLESFALVRQAQPDAQLTIAGPPMPDVDVDEITRRALEIGNVRVMPGYVPLEDVPALFGAHRVVVFTYDTVNVSGSVHMAYTFGRPVIASDVGGMGDVVEDGITGLLAKHTASDVAKQLLIVLTNDADADRMGSEAASRIDGSASWSTTATQAEHAYRGALSNSPEGLV